MTYLIDICTSYIDYEIINEQLFNDWYHHLTLILISVYFYVLTQGKKVLILRTNWILPVKAEIDGPSPPYSTGRIFFGKSLCKELKSEWTLNWINISDNQYTLKFISFLKNSIDDVLIGIYPFSYLFAGTSSDDVIKSAKCGRQLDKMQPLKTYRYSFLLMKETTCQSSFLN